MDAKSVRNMYSIIAVTNKHTAKLHHVGSLYILQYIGYSRSGFYIEISVAGMSISTSR